MRYILSFYDSYSEEYLLDATDETILTLIKRELQRGSILLEIIEEK